MIYRVICLVLLLFTQFIYAVEVYHWTDAQGRSHYSDKKHKDASAYKLSKSDSYYKVKKVYDGDTVLLADGRKMDYSQTRENASLSC